MSAHTSECTLCIPRWQGRISSELSNKYVEIAQLPDKERKKRIEGLLTTYPPCAVARMALVYMDSELADALKGAYGNADGSLRVCASSGSIVAGHRFPLRKVVGAVHEYIFNAAHTHNGNISPKDTLVDMVQSGEDFPREPEYAPHTNQEWQERIFSAPELGIKLSIVSEQSSQESH